MSHGDSATSVTSTEEAFATEFIYFIETDATKSRVHELCRKFNIGPIQTTKLPKLKELLGKHLRKLKAPKVQSLIVSAEHKELDARLSTRKVDKVVLGKKGKIDIRKLCDDSNYKLTGGEAGLLLLCGGAETAFHHLNAFTVNLKLKNREALQCILKQLTDLEIKGAQTEASFDKLLSRISDLRDISPSDISRLDADEVGLELAELVDEGTNFAEDVNQFREEIIILGQDAVKLYSGNNNVEVDPTMKKIIDVFQAFKNLYTLILCPSSEDPQEMIREISENYRPYVENFVASVKNSQLNISLAEHSEYMHIVCAPKHLESQVLYTLNQYGSHFTRFNEEASEANHRIMRAVLIRMQGFTHRAVGNAGSKSRFKSTCVFNKVSYLMHNTKFLTHLSFSPYNGSEVQTINLWYLWCNGPQPEIMQITLPIVSQLLL